MSEAVYRGLKNTERVNLSASSDVVGGFHGYLHPLVRLLEELGYQS